MPSAQADADCALRHSLLIGMTHSKEVTMNSSGYLNTAPVLIATAATRLESQLRENPQFAEWFRNNYRPLAGAWQY